MRLLIWVNIPFTHLSLRVSGPESFMGRHLQGDRLGEARTDNVKGGHVGDYVDRRFERLSAYFS